MKSFLFYNVGKDHSLFPRVKHLLISSKNGIQERVENLYLIKNITLQSTF